MPPAPYRPPSHNVGDSRRSPRDPRDASPGRYNDRIERNDRDEYRGGSHAPDRRRSIPDIRANNNNAFNSNRDAFREPMGREASRDFPPRDTPRGPKNLIDAPTGPRASNYGSEYRDRGEYGYRGDYRNDRGSRGRGRGWRDDSRDRGRDVDRNYRRDRDDRGPSHFRDESGRERWGREPYNRPRRPNSPGRARSPPYAPRDSRDPPPNIEIDRTRRGSRDGPLSGGSPSAENVPFSRGYNRAPRGMRGRGRGGYYDDHRRSRSPDVWARRTQPSATPPPQVPAFGSNMSISGPVPGSSMSISSPVPGVLVPTAPRSERVFKRGPNRQVQSIQSVVDNSVDRDGTTNPSELVIASATANTGQKERDNPKVSTDEGKTTSELIPSEAKDTAVVREDSKERTEPAKRKPMAAKRQPKPIVRDDSDVEDSADDLDDNYFVEEIAKINDKIGQAPADPAANSPAGDLPDETAANSGAVDEHVTDTADGASPNLCKSEDDTEKESISEPKPSTDTVAPEIPSSAAASLLVSEQNIPATSPLPNPEQSTKPSETDVTTSTSKSHPLIDEEAAPKNAVLPDPAPSSTSLDQNESAVPNWNPTSYTQAPSIVSPKTPLGEAGPPSPRDTTADSTKTSAVEKQAETSKPRTSHLAPGGLDVAAFLNGSQRPSHQKSLTPEPNANAVNGNKGEDNSAVRPRFGLSPGFLDPKNDAPSRRDSRSSTRRPSATPSYGNAGSSRNASGDLPIAAPRPVKPKMDTFDDDDDDIPVPITREELDKVRPYMKTPPLDSLPKPNCKPFEQDEEFQAQMAREWADEEKQKRVKEMILEQRRKQRREEDEFREDFKQKMLAYRRWTDFSEEEIPRKSREAFAKSKERAAAEAAAPHPSALASSTIKPEGRHRTGSRWATEHDLERIIKQSEQEAKEKKEMEERTVRANTANAKEATIPKLLSKEEWDREAFTDTSGLVDFDRSFELLEYGEPIDTFSEEECRLFDEAYFQYPKQFSKIAEALPGRDYKECIAHYYHVKHATDLKERCRRQPKKRKKKGATKNPKSNALMADLGLTGQDDGDEAQDPDPSERRGRPKRAAAPTWPIETLASESDVASPAPTPGRKQAASKVDPNGEPPPPPRRKTKTPREKGTKQAKNNPLLAAAPSTSVNRQPDSPAPSLPSTEWKHRREPSANPRISGQFDGAMQSLPMFPAAIAPAEKQSQPLPMNQDIPPNPYVPQERLESAPPSGIEPQQDRRSNQQTSSYWSVPEQTEFPALLKHFGSDWHGIAKHMCSKTHIMVYRHLFDWLNVPSDSNKSRYVTNILLQVKNYYQRQVDSGKFKDWEEFVREADARRDRGEMPPDLPPSAILPKRRYDSGPRSGSAMELTDDATPLNQPKPMTQASPPQPSLSSRFPALAQAGPVPQIQPSTPTSVLNKHLPPQPIQQVAQQAQQVPRQPRPGPTLGYFSHTGPPDLRDPSRDPRPIMQANTPVSERSLAVAQEAQAERQRAEKIRDQHEQQVAMQREQQLQQQQALHQQQAQQRERQFQLKQETDTPDLRQYDAYPAPQMHASNMAQSRAEPPNTTPTSGPESRRTTAPPLQYQPRIAHPARSYLGDGLSGMREIKSTPSPAAPRPPMSAPPTTQEQYPPPQSSLQHIQPQHHQSMSQHPPQSTPKPQPAPQAVPPPRPQETVRKTSSIMSLLNNDEPSDPRPTPAKRVSDVSSSALQPSRTPPPPQPSLQNSRYSAHASQLHTQGSQMSQQMGTQQPVQQIHSASGQHVYGQPSPHPHALHQHSSSIGNSRSYTPTGFDRGSYGQAPVQQQNIQQMYSPVPRSALAAPQPHPIRREPSLGDLHGVSNGYRSSAPSQSRLKESPYSQSTPTIQTPIQRQPAASPMDMPPASERDYYARQQQSSYLMQGQHSATSSPQPGVYHSQSLQQPQPSHRQLAFGQSPAHVASPPPQHTSQHSLHRSRGNSFDGRFQMPTSASGSASHGYAQAPQHQQTPPAGPPASLQFQHQSHDRYETAQERERRMQDEAYLQHQRRWEEQRRMDDSRRQ